MRDEETFDFPSPSGVEAAADRPRRLNRGYDFLVFESWNTVSVGPLAD